MGEDDLITKYLPDFPWFGYEGVMKVHHLIHHTSGLKDIAYLFGFQSGSTTIHYTTKDYIKLIKSQKGLNHPPGEKFR
jgi:CubicO group peptidase (beta-lactamase class C family)